MKPLKSERLPMLEDIMYTEPKDWQKRYEQQFSMFDKHTQKL